MSDFRPVLVLPAGSRSELAHGMVVTALGNECEYSFCVVLTQCSGSLYPLKDMKEGKPDTSVLVHSPV
jgi:hypothetical protein